MSRILPLLGIAAHGLAGTVYRVVRTVLKPSWLAFHVLTLALVVGMVVCGRWQFMVAQSHGDAMRNYMYAGQWIVFAGFTAWMWWRIVSHEVRPRIEDLMAQGDAAAVARQHESGQVRTRRRAPLAIEAPPTVPLVTYTPPGAADEDGPTDNDQPDATRADYNRYLQRLSGSESN